MQFETRTGWLLAHLPALAIAQTPISLPYQLAGLSQYPGIGQSVRGNIVILGRKNEKGYAIIAPIGMRLVGWVDLNAKDIVPGDLVNAFGSEDADGKIVVHELERSVSPSVLGEHTRLCLRQRSRRDCNHQTHTTRRDTDD